MGTRVFRHPQQSTTEQAVHNVITTGRCGAGQTKRSRRFTIRKIRWRTILLQYYDNDTDEKYEINGSRSFRGVPRPSGPLHLALVGRLFARRPGYWPVTDHGRGLLAGGPARARAGHFQQGLLLARRRRRQYRRRRVWRRFLRGPVHHHGHLLLMVVRQRSDDAAVVVGHAVAGHGPVGDRRRAVRRRLRHPVNGRRDGRLLLVRREQLVVRLVRRRRGRRPLLVLLVGRRVRDGAGQRLKPLQQLRLKLLVGCLDGLIEVEIEIHWHVIGAPMPRRRRWQVLQIRRRS